MEHVLMNFGPVPGFMYSENENCDPCYSLDGDNLLPFGPDSVYEFHHPPPPYELYRESTFCTEGEQDRSSAESVDECFWHVMDNFNTKPGRVVGFMYSDNKNCDPCYRIEDKYLLPFGPDKVY